MKKKLILGIIMLVLLAALNVNAETKKEKPLGSNYIIIFQVTDYTPKIAETVEYIFKNMLKAEDRLTLFSPVKPYNFSQKTRQAQSVEKLIKLTKSVLKRDIIGGTASYKQILGSMKQAVIEIGSEINGGGFGSSSGVSTLKNQLVNYKTLLKEMRNLRKLNETFFLKLADMLKKLDGKSYIYIVYQKELRIIPNRDVMEALRKNPDIKFDAMEVFAHDSSEEFINIENVSKALNASSTTLNLFYIKGKEKKRRGMEIKEFSGDVYNVFSKLAKATGGMVISTSKPKAAFEKVGKDKG